MQPTIQTTVLRNLVTNGEYTRRVIPYIKKEFFEGEHKDVFQQVVDFVDKYNQIPTREALVIEMENSSMAESTFASAVELVNEISRPEAADFDWLLTTTEKWCQDRAVFLAIMESVGIIDGKGDKSQNAIPGLLSDALSVSFDQNIGHDYFENSEERYEFYNASESRIPFDLDKLNIITKGGVPNKTLNVILAGTGAGKSLFMCHHAASLLTQGKNVLYITMEMAEERIAERIDANLLNTPIDMLAGMKKTTFTDKIKRLSSNTQGKLVIKEYPTGAAHAGHFRALLNELSLKKTFKPDIIFVDYLNICASSRMKPGGSVNSYTLIKSIAEELRGLAVEFDLPLFTATQTTRSGYGDSDVGLQDTSESFGLPATADLMFALIANEELDGVGQLMIKQLKNRYNDPSSNKRFVIGVDRSRMKLYDVEENAQSLVDTTPGIKQQDTKDFSGFKL